EDVRADYEKLFQFAIYRIKTVTLNQYIKKLLATGEYAEAEKLAIKDGEFDLDLIFKQQWLDAAETDESLVSVLRKVKDKTWVITECLNCKSTDPEIQRMLLDLAEMSIDEVNDPVLNEKVKNARLIFNCLEEVPDVFLKYRSMSLVEAALHFAEEANIDLLI
uniref:Uncharacterized protein n=1 Tax=Panagrolaimus sp. JU765 TaxID=591449 RepID=A0AC34QCI2_9BILA